MTGDTYLNDYHKSSIGLRAKKHTVARIPYHALFFVFSDYRLRVLQDQNIAFRV